MLKVTCAIIIHQNKILVNQRNTSSDHPLKWEFPGGKLKPGETEEKCIVREIREELEIEIEIRKPMVSLIHDYGFKKIELIPFLCVLKSGELKLKEHHDFNWVTLKELEKIDFVAADRRLIQHSVNQEILKKYLRENMNDSR
ncbi:MAG TPA: NUDIX domain-containing protein [Draconibacterium sp.]|nr:NUDIX domain-containing protein [Draconibacterium sp.]